MVTNQIMTRKMAGYDVVQRTEDGFFDANFLIHQWNSKEENKRRRLDDFLESSNTKEFISALKEDESQWRKIENGRNQAVIKVKGRNTKNGRTRDATWMHPLLFFKFAMWINPRFELKVIKFISDKMLDFRNKAGDAYKSLSTAVQSLPGSMCMKSRMEIVAKAVNYIVLGKHKSMIMNSDATEENLEERFYLIRRLTDDIREGRFNSFEEFHSHLSKIYKTKYVPKILY